MSSSATSASATADASASAAAAAAPKHFDISQLPSLKDGMTVQEEAIKRRKTCRFIEEAGRILKLPRVAVSTAMVFFHRFYAKHSFQEHDRFEVAVAAIVLAAKTEESPKKLNQVIDECYKLKVRGMQSGRISQGASGATSASNTNNNTTTGSLDPKGEEFLKLKERILLLERVILHTIGFELSIDHPYKFLVEQIKKMVQKRQLEYIPSNDTTAGAVSSSSQSNKPSLLNEMVQYAMNFANDSMQTSLCLQFEPQKIATATVYLAGNFAKVRPTNNKDWLEVLGYPDVHSLASICLQLIELITERKGADQEIFKKIRAHLDKVKDERGSLPGAGKTAAVAAPPPPPTENRDAKRPRTS